jgi:hypothetical protein
LLFDVVMAGLLSHEGKFEAVFPLRHGLHAEKRSRSIAKKRLVTIFILAQLNGLAAIGQGARPGPFSLVRKETDGNHLAALPGLG